MASSVSGTTDPDADMEASTRPESATEVRISLRDTEGEIHAERREMRPAPAAHARSTLARRILFLRRTNAWSSGRSMRSSVEDSVMKLVALHRSMCNLHAISHFRVVGA